MNSCFTCLYQDIVETSHEWIECFCKAKGGQKVDIQYNCPLYKAKDKNNDSKESTI